MGKSRHWIIAALLIIAAPVWAGNIKTVLGSDETQNRVADLGDETGKLRDAVADLAVSNGEVHELAANMFEKIPSTIINIDVALRGWDFEPAPEDGEVDIDSIVSKADDRLFYYNKSVPPPELLKAHQYVHLLREAGHIGFDRQNRLGDSQMGEYRYHSDSPDLGQVTMHMVLRGVAKLVGRAFILPTLFHEAAHARDHQAGDSDPDAVIRKEISASLTEYYLLTVIDPYGERLAYLRTFMMDEVKLRPTHIKKQTLAYLNHLAELRETEGKRDRIKKFVLARGYQDGHQHAPHPTRS